MGNLILLGALVIDMGRIGTIPAFGDTFVPDASAEESYKESSPTDDEFEFGDAYLGGLNCGCAPYDHLYKLVIYELNAEKFAGFYKSGPKCRAAGRSLGCEWFY